jgi:integrin-linked kinase
MDEFFNAIEQGDAAAVRAYLAADPTLVNAVDTRVKAPVNLGQKGFILLADAIPEELQKPRLPNRSTDTALHVAARHGHMEIAHVLVEHGARADAVNRSRRTALHEARIRGKLELAEFLIASGADVKAQSANGTL